MSGKTADAGDYERSVWVSYFLSALRRDSGAAGKCVALGGRYGPTPKMHLGNFWPMGI